MSDNKRKISKAPDPIKPLSGSQAFFPWRTIAKKPDWREWKHIPVVRPWQACALSLDIDPHSMKSLPHAYMAGSTKSRSFEPESFPSEDAKTKFESRQRILLANIGHNVDVIHLLDFVAWCRSIEGFDIPQELAALANTSDKKADVTETETRPTTKVEEISLDRANDRDFDKRLAALFDPVPVTSLEKMFPANGKWVKWKERAKANGLIDARKGRAMFNPYEAGSWFLRKGIPGWDIARLHRTLKNNLPARSCDDSRLLMVDDSD